jgi:ubiquinone/menaquinone biosynthesis C-methylase UbiE
MRVARRWRYGRVIPTVYDFFAERERLARVGGRLLWSADARPMFAPVPELAPGAAVLDLPCGGGLAFRGVPSGPAPRYVAADLSPVMLERARVEAARRGVQVALAQLSADRLPFSGAVFDLCLSYNGLHCFGDPAAVIAEIARVLRPGGTLRGCAVVTGAGARQDAVIALLRRSGDFRGAGTTGDLRGWLTAAGLAEPEVRASGAMAFFRAVKPGRTRP